HSSPVGLITIILKNLKVLVLLLPVSILIMVYSSRDFMIAINEREPTPIAIERWSTDYHGTRWLSVTGTLRPDLAAQNSQGTAFVPLVARDAKAGDPIHVVVVGRPSMARRPNPATITGELAPSNWNLAMLLPGQTFAADVV